jgi:hypothetical protein
LRAEAARQETGDGQARLQIDLDQQQRTQERLTRSLQTLQGSSFFPPFLTQIHCFFNDFLNDFCAQKSGFQRTCNVLNIVRHLSLLKKCP